MMRVFNAREGKNMCSCISSVHWMFSGIFGKECSSLSLELDATTTLSIGCLKLPETAAMQLASFVLSFQRAQFSFQASSGAALRARRELSSGHKCKFGLISARPEKVGGSLFLRPSRARMPNTPSFLCPRAPLRNLPDLRTYVQAPLLYSI